MKTKAIIESYHKYGGVIMMNVLSGVESVIVQNSKHGICKIFTYEQF